MSRVGFRTNNRYMCIIYKQIFYFQRGVSNRDDRRSNYLQNKYVKPQCYEFGFNMISGLPVILLKTFTIIILRVDSRSHKNR